MVPGKPVPKDRLEEGRLAEEGQEYAREGTEKFITFLDDIEVKKILVGGTSLEIIDGELDRCVGNFILVMKHYGDTDVKLSMGSAPLNRTDIKESYPDLA